MTARRIPHLPPQRYRSDGRLVDYSVSVKMIITNTKELTGMAYTWDSLSKSIEDKSPESVEDLVVIVQDITVDWENYDYQLKQALAKGVTEENLLEYFYNYTESDGWERVQIEYKTIYQKDNTPWGFFINPKAKEKLFRDILPFLLNPTQYFWGEIKGKIIAYAASNRNFDIEIFKLIDFISYIFAKKWELGKGECANDPVSENFTYPRLEPLTQAISYFNNALILTLSTTAKNLFENAKYPYQREMVKKITRINTLKDFVDLMENEEHPSEEEKQLLMLKVIHLLDQYLREKGFEINDLVSAFTEKGSNNYFQQFCNKKKILFPPPGTYSSYNRLLELYHELEAQEIFGQVWEAYYGFDALIDDFQKSFEQKENYVIPIEDQINQYYPKISETIPVVETKINESRRDIRSKCKSYISFWDRLTPITQERIIDLYYYEDNNAGGDFEPAIMKLATSLENELTEQLLGALTEKHPQECKDLKIYDVLKIEGYKRLIEKYGHKIFKYDRPVCREWIKKLDTLRKIRAHGPAHSIRGASKYGLDEFKSILFGHSSDKVSFFEEIFRLKNVLT